MMLTHIPNNGMVRTRHGGRSRDPNWAPLLWSW
jgi:hypothetical protein